jgi:hypothetical protein
MSEPGPELHGVPDWAILYDAGEYERCSYTADVVGLALDPATGTPHALVVERGGEPFAGLHAWPGGFVDLLRDEDSRVTALRELREETGRRDAGFLEVLGVYDRSGRDPRQFAGFWDAAAGAWVRRGVRVVTTAHLALMHPDGPAPRGGGDASAAFWTPVYDYLPWEDRRSAGGEAARAFRALAGAGAAGPDAERAFGQGGHAWNEELAPERYALLEGAGLLPEARRDRWGRETPGAGPALGRAMAFDHRRILADALGRVRGKIKYVPAILHALAAERFTLDELQRVVEGIAGRPLHRPNFRRSVTARREPLVEPAGTFRAPTRSLGVGAQEYVFRAPALPRLRTSLEYPWDKLP